MLHGLAGSGALTALAMSSLPSPSMRIAYALLFGIASSVGMALVSGLAGLSIARLSRSDRSVRTISLATGLLSMSVSGLWGLPILIGWLGPR